MNKTDKNTYQKAEGHFAAVDLFALIRALEKAVCGLAKEESHRPSLNGICFYPRPAHQTPNDGMKDGFTGLEVLGTDGHALQLCRIPDQRTGDSDNCVWAKDIYGAQGQKERTVIVRRKGGIDTLIKNLKAELSLHNKEAKEAEAKAVKAGKRWVPYQPFVSLGTKTGMIEGKKDSPYLTVIVNRYGGTTGLSGVPIIEDTYPDCHAILDRARAHKQGDSDGLYFDKKQMVDFLKGVAKGRGAKEKRSLYVDFDLTADGGSRISVSLPAESKGEREKLDFEADVSLPFLVWAWDKGEEFDYSSKRSFSYNLFLRAMSAMDDNVCLRLPEKNDNSYSVFVSGQETMVGFHEHRASKANPPAESDLMLWNLRPYALHILMPVYD